MKDWLRKFEDEKKKLNQLGNESLEKGIPLFRNDAVQAQSRKVDELIVELHHRIGLKQQLR